jgi:hypothetical protein
MPKITEQHASVARIEEVHEYLAQFDPKLRLVAFWELRKKTSSFLMVESYGDTPEEMSDGPPTCTWDPSSFVDIEIAVLSAAVAYAERAHYARKACTVGVGVSFETLTSVAARIRYTSVLEVLSLPQSVSMVLKIERVPDGAPLEQVAELVDLVRAYDLRCMVGFEFLATIPKLTTRIAAIGLGGALPKWASFERAISHAERLVKRAESQKAFAFLERLESPALVDAARVSNVRLGSGAGLGAFSLSGLEPIPSFPLHIH